jgi:hypothetical protein
MVLVRYAVAVTHPTIGTLFVCMSLSCRLIAKTQWLIPKTPLLKSEFGIAASTHGNPLPHTSAT